MKTKEVLPLFFFLVLCPMFLTAQDKGPNSPDSHLKQTFERDVPWDYQSSDHEVLALWKEHLIVHLDRNAISADSPLFFNAYVVTGPDNIRVTQSKVLKTELLNGQNEIVSVQYHKIEDGRANGTIMLPKKLIDKTYTLRAYTRWMQNYGESVYHLSTLENLEALPFKDGVAEGKRGLKVTFYPESGHLLENVTNRLLIKITGAEGEPLDMEGELVDDKGRVIVRPARFGTGLFSTLFMPEPETAYYLLTIDGQRFPVPDALRQGFALRTNNLNTSKLDVQVLATNNNEGAKVVLKGEMGGITYLEKELTVRGTVQTLEIPKTKIPSGILNLNLYSSTGDKLVARTVRIDPPYALTIALVDHQMEKESGQFRATLRVTDKDGRPVRTQLALSATNYPLEPILYGARENIDALNISSRAQRYEEDIQLLTQPLEEKNMEAMHTLNKIKYPFQQGLDLFGYAYNLNNELLRKTKILMYASTKEGPMVQEFESDGQGRVRLQNLQFVGETQLVFRTQGDESVSRLVKVVPIQEEHDPNTGDDRYLAIKDLDKKDRITASPWIPENDSDVIYLDEVEVAENKPKKEESKPSIYGVEALRKVYQDPQRPRTIPELFLGIPGVQVVNLGDLNPRVSLPRAAGVGPVLWVLDGLPLIQPTSLVDIMNMVPFTDVERIEIIDWAQAALFGTRAAGGVIAIYTRTASGVDYIKRKEGQFVFHGYADAPPFEFFKEAMAKKPKKFADKASTVYWNPALETNDKGEVSIQIDAPIPFNELRLKASTVELGGAIGSFQGVY
jgi:hypothetical protein